MTLHKEFWGLLFIVFVSMIFLSSDAHERINRACKPIEWVGSVVVSLSALAVPQHQVRVKGWFDSLDYGCQYTVWRVFYQDDYNKYLESQKRLSSAPTAVVPAKRAASAPAASSPAVNVPATTDGALPIPTPVQQ